MTASGDLVVHDLDEFAERLEDPTPEQAEAIARALADGELEAWLEVRWDPLEQVPQMVERLRALQQRVGKRPGLACYALRNLLDPDEPLPLLPGVALVRPEDIAVVLDEVPQERRLRLEALQGRIEGGYVEEWLRAREAPQAEQTLALLQDSARRYPREPLLQAHVFRWIYAPGGGVPFMGQEVNDPRQLAALIDSSKASRQGGQELLRSGWLRQWLLASGRLKDPRPLDRVLDDERLPQEGKLESVLHLLDTSLAWPNVECEPKELDFGKVWVGETVARTLRVRKSGRGYLWGGLQVNGASGVILDRNDFQGEDTEVTVSARPNALMAGSRQEGSISVTTADNVTTTVPWRYKAVSAEQPSRKWVFIGIVVSFVAVLATLFNYFPRNRDQELILGSWYDGGPLCVHISRGETSSIFLMKLWYCEAGFEIASEVPLHIEGNKFVGKMGGVSVQLISTNELSIRLTTSIRDKLNNEYGPGKLEVTPRFMRNQFDFAIAYQERYRNRSNRDSQRVFFERETIIVSSVTNEKHSWRLPERMNAQHRKVLSSWLDSNKHRFRPATITDCMCEKDDLQNIRMDFGDSYHPYYARGDFNHDGDEDFAVVVIDTTIPTTQALPKNTGLLIFNGPFKEQAVGVHYVMALGAPPLLLLFVDSKSSALKIGKWQSNKADVLLTEIGYFLNYGPDF